MNKKILIVSVSAVLTLVAITLVSAINTSTATSIEKKESPLFRVRTRQAIRNRLQELREGIKTRFVGERVFFLPFQYLKRRLYNSPTQTDQLTCFGKDMECTDISHTCFPAENTCDSECYTNWPCTNVCY